MVSWNSDYTFENIFNSPIIKDTMLPVDKAIGKAKSKINIFLSWDALKDVPKHATNETIENMIAYEEGNLIQLSVVKFDESRTTIFIPANKITLRGIRRRIEQEISSDEFKKYEKHFINWKYIWKNFALSFDTLSSPATLSSLSA